MLAGGKKMNSELIKGSTITLILKLLSEEAMYGYGLIKALEEKSQGIFLFKEGTLYPILHDLEKKDLIMSYWEAIEGQRKRKYYKITDKGIKELSSRKKEWEVFSNTMNNLLGWER